jgi:hypothetical protein
MKTRSVVLFGILMALAASKASAHNFGSCDPSWDLCAVSAALFPGDLGNYISSLQWKDGRRMSLEVDFEDNSDFFLALVPDTQQVVAVSKVGWGWAPQFTPRIEVGTIDQPVGDDANMAFARSFTPAPGVQMDVQDVPGFHSYCNDDMGVPGAFVTVYNTSNHTLNFLTAQNQLIATFVSEENISKLGYEKNINTPDNKCPNGVRNLGPINYWNQ